MTTDNTPLNADDELRVTFATIPEELCKHGVNLSLCNCHRCDGTAIYTEADRKKHELRARIDSLLTAKRRIDETDAFELALALGIIDSELKKLGWTPGELKQELESYE